MTALFPAVDTPANPGSATHFLLHIDSEVYGVDFEQTVRRNRDQNVLSAVRT